jgi:hypothetical protein
MIMPSITNPNRDTDGLKNHPRISSLTRCHMFYGKKRQQIQKLITYKKQIEK